MTLLLGSTLQGVALVFYLIADRPHLALSRLGLFGLFQGGIVPSYAIIVREYFPPREAASARRPHHLHRPSSAWRWAAGWAACCST